MKKIILSFAFFAFSTTALAMAVPPNAREKEAAAEKVIPQSDMVELRTAEQTIRNARKAGASTPTEISDTAGLHKAAENAVLAAVKARLALDVGAFNQQAAIVIRSRDRACAILSGC